MVGDLSADTAGTYIDSGGIYTGNLTASQVTTGSQVIQGKQGTTGAQGTQGSHGSVGPGGSQGSQGTQGSSGGGGGATISQAGAGGTAVQGLIPCTWVTGTPFELFDMPASGMAPMGYCSTNVGGTDYHWPVWIQL